MSICCVHVLLRMRILVCICMCVYLRLGIYIIGEKGCSCFREWERRQGHRSHARVQVKRDCVGDSSSMGEGRDWGGEGGGRGSESFVKALRVHIRDRQRQTEPDTCHDVLLLRATARATVSQTQAQAQTQTQ